MRPAFSADRADAFGRHASSVVAAGGGQGYRHSSGIDDAGSDGAGFVGIVIYS